MIKKLGLLFIFLIIACVFTLIFSFSTSPLYSYFGYDSAIFMLVGKAIASGKLLYVDIFDHKGPLFFFLEALMVKIGGIDGIIWFQTINMLVILYLFYKTYSLFKLPLKHFWIPLTILLVMLAAMFEGGNTTEEFSLPYLLICLCFSIKYALSNEKEHPVKYAFLYGCVFAIMAYTRLTNSAGLCGIVAAIGIYLIINKKWKNILLNALFFIAGIVTISAPIFIYFIWNDALDEMIYATFTFNFKYADTFHNSFDGSLKDIIYWGRIILPNIFTLITLALYSIYSEKKNLRLILIVTCMSIATVTALNLGLRTDHYMMFNTLPLLMGSIFLVKLIVDKKCNKIVLAALCIYITLLSLYFAKRASAIYDIYEQDKQNMFYPLDVNLALKLIPENERDSVFGYNLASNWYLETNMLPPYRFYTSQEIWTRTDSLVVRETTKYLETTPPKWIVIPNVRIVYSAIGVDSNPVLKKMLENDYEYKGADYNHTYYRRKNLN